MSTANPWFKFYPADWQSDHALRLCSLAARGLWIEMLGIMHQADPRGHLLVKGQPPTDTQLAVLAGTSPDQIPSLLEELESAEVFSRTRAGVIYSRRMTNDEKKAKHARKIGKEGGNPALRKGGTTNRNKKGNSTQDKHADKGGDNHQVKPTRAHKPEARGQNTPKPPLKGAERSPDNDLMNSIFDAAGIDDSRMVNPSWHQRQWQIVTGWLEAGLDPPTIIDTVKQTKANTRQKPTSLQFFDANVRQAEPDPNAGEEKIHGLTRTQWRQIMAIYAEKFPKAAKNCKPEVIDIAKWEVWPIPHHCAPPGEPGSKVPPDILQEFGFAEAELFDDRQRG